MYKETKELLIQSAMNKVKLLKESKWKYLVASALAGAYVGIGIFLIMIIGQSSVASGSEYTKVFMGLGFGIALSLVIMAGSELFTGNNMVMMVGSLDRKIKWGDSFWIWGISYIGNFIGSMFIAGLFVLTKIQGTATGEFIINTAATKMSGDFGSLLVKGILCNILVCLAVLCSIKLKSESAKLIMIAWCLFAFIASGFEHSIANMTIFSMSLFMEHPESISIGGMFANLIPVTIGNFIGGGIILGGSYYFIGK